MLNKISNIAKDTLISVYEDSQKEIQYISEVELIKVWNFDEGKFDFAEPLFIMGPSVSNEYTKYVFDDGSELKIVGECFIFDKELGVFNNSLSVGSKSINVNGDEIMLISQEIINGEIEYYTIITNHHMNLFSNGILTSCSYNNLYTIENMMFVKENREPKNRGDFSEINSVTYKGLRISEQPESVITLKSDILDLKSIVDFF